MQDISRDPVDTYEGQVNGSTLDYIAVPVDLCNLITESFVHGWVVLNTSDHVPVSVTLNLRGISRSCTHSELKGHIKWKKLTDFDKYFRYQGVLEPLLTVITAEFNASPKGADDIDHAFTEIINAIRSVSETFPHSKYKRNLKPYWNEELSQLKYNKVVSYRKWVLAGRPRSQLNPLFIEYKSDKKLFHSSLKRLSKEYENQEILEAVKTAEINRNSFWRLINTARKSSINGVTAIRRTDKVVVHEVTEVLDVWAGHFLRIGTPKNESKYDEVHYRSVTDFVETYNNGHDDDLFLGAPFTSDEILKSINTLHFGKAPGFDGVMSEHLSYAGPMLVDTL